MAAPTLSARYAAQLPWSANPLMRHGDRVFGIVLVSVTALLLLALPLSIWSGTATYQTVSARSADTIPVTATVTEVTAADPTATETNATVTWRHDGLRGSGTTSVPRGTTVGTTVDLYTNREGTALVDRVGPIERILCAIWVAILGWAAVAVLAGVALSFTRRRVEARHSVEWEREWLQAAGTPNGWAAR